MAEFNETSPEIAGISIFRGLPGEECEELIRGIRSRAFAEGKQRDNEWLCDFASTCFAGTALRWYEELDEDVQQDWKQLRRALLTKWPRQEETVILENPSTPQSPHIPTPAAAAPPPPGARVVFNPTSPARTGIIRAIFTSDRNPGDWYLSRDVYDSSNANPTFEGCCVLKAPKDNAMRVQFSASSGGAPTTMMLLNSSSGKNWLGAAWSTSRPKSDSGSTSYAILTTVTGLWDKSPTSMQHASWKNLALSSIWTVAADGTVGARWKDYSGTERTLGFVVLPPGKFGLPIEAVVDPDAFVAKYPGWVKARLEFIPEL